jgi:hypothetical protein
MLNAQELGVLYMNADHPLTICDALIIYLHVENTYITA